MVFKSAILNNLLKRYDPNLEKCPAFVNAT